ncbi:hypothetical protein [Streptomyces sp. NPDC058308]|uniref:hypothetical protein n=1 Tax=Streptomyces sp. NPDC058308 TaxID=3346440 RepID=UPI0036EDED2F
MQNLFMGAFVLAVIVQSITICVLLAQLWHFLKHKGPEPTALEGLDALTGAALFGAAMTVLQWMTSTWDDVSWSDMLVFAAVFGIATAGCMTAARRAGHTKAPNVLLLIPLGFGVMAGASGASF